MAGAFQIGWSVQDLEPILKAFYGRGRKGKEGMFWTNIYGGTESSQKAVETVVNYPNFPGLTGFGSGGLIPNFTLRDAYVTKFTHRLFGGLTGIAKETIDDSQYGVPKKAGEMLGRSARLCMERVAHEPINAGFLTPLSDGQPLFSSNHPSLAGGPLGDNLAAIADPSFTALDNLMVKLNWQVDDAGNPVIFRDVEKKWLVHPIFEAAALQALESISTATVLSSGTGNANSGLVNPYKGQGMGRTMLVADPFIDDNDSSYLIASGAHEGLFFVREDAELDTWKSNNPRVIYTSKVLRLSAGFSDWRGIAGNQGA